MNLKDVQNLDMGELKDLKWKLEAFLRAVDRQIESMCLSECSLCAHIDLAFEDIPEGWGWLKSQTGYLLCPKCIQKWKDKFGEEPNVWKRGDEIGNDI